MNAYKIDDRVSHRFKGLGTVKGIDGDKVIVSLDANPTTPLVFYSEMLTLAKHEPKRKTNDARNGAHHER